MNRNDQLMSREWYLDDEEFPNIRCDITETDGTTAREIVIWGEDSHGNFRNIISDDVARHIVELHNIFIRS